MAFFEKTKIEYQDNGVSNTVSAQSPLPSSDPGGATSLLYRILAVLTSPLGYDKSLGRQRVTAVVESGTVTGLTNIDSRPGSMLINSMNFVAWHDCVRSRIT